MTKEREELELRIGWDLSDYPQSLFESIVATQTLRKMTDEEIIEELLSWYRENILPRKDMVLKAKLVLTDQWCAKCEVAKIRFVGVDGEDYSICLCKEVKNDGTTNGDNHQTKRRWNMGGIW